MKKSTQAKLSEMKAANWFVNIGQPWDGDVRVVNSWSAAIDSCLEQSWQEFILEASNQYADRLLRANIERFNSWNEMVLALKPYAQVLVEIKTQALVILHNVPKNVIRVMEWDMMHLLLEVENADVVKPGFFSEQAVWYAKGRFPCGYEGKFPDGCRVIF